MKCPVKLNGNGIHIFENIDDYKYDTNEEKE